MAGGADDRAIFDAGNAPDDVIDNGAGADDQPLIQTRTADDLAVSDAIRQLNKGAPAPAPRLPTPSAPQPGTMPGEAEPEDRTTAGLMRALLDERDRRQAHERQLERYRTQEAERTRQEEAARVPLSDRLFQDPDATIAELTRSITDPLQQQIETMRVQHDFNIAGIKHGSVFADAYAAWFNKVGTGQDAATYFKIMKAPAPGEALVSWFKEEQRNSTVGDDIEAYNARIIREHYEKQGLPVPAELLGGDVQQPEQRFSAAPAVRDPATGRFSAPPQARIPTATSRIGQSGGGLNDRDEDGSDASIFDSGRPERGRAR